MIVRAFRFLAWEYRRRSSLRALTPKVREDLRRIAEKPISIGCPICNAPFMSGWRFRWHILGHD